MKNTYIEIMDRAFQSYTKEQIADYYERVKKEGLTEHGFPRLASNLGVLICHGRHTELLPLFVDLMDLCCEQMPKVHAANDFSVREVVTCIVAVEKAGILPKEKTNEWRAAIASLEPKKCYDCIAVHPTQIIGNWSLFNAVSEYARIWGGFVKEDDVKDYMKVGAPLILSGIINERAEQVREAVRAHGFTIEKEIYENDWVGMLVRI